MDIESKAVARGIPTFLVTDAGMTQVYPKKTLIISHAND
jgi:peptidyl-tRNA hydrolase